MNRYVISGAHKTAGTDVRVEIEALTEADARAAAIKEGVLITECKMIGAQTPSYDPAQAQMREILLWVRFIGITIAILIFAMILKVISGWHP